MTFRSDATNSAVFASLREKIKQVLLVYYIRCYNLKLSFDPYLA